jgi:carbonic anhydrase
MLCYDLFNNPFAAELTPPVCAYKRMSPSTSSSHSVFPRFTSDTPITTLIARNHAWASRQAHQNPELFPTLADGQRPQILWIGCSDSRVPETTVLDLLPGDVFVHRNMGNIVDVRDMSVLSAIEFAVETLAVKHIIICGIFLLSVN